MPPLSSGVFFATAPSLSRPHLFAVRSVYFYFDAGRLNLATDFDALVEAETADLQLWFTSCFFKLFVSSFFFVSTVIVGESCFEWSGSEGSSFMLNPHSGLTAHIPNSFLPLPSQRIHSHKTYTRFKRRPLFPVNVGTMLWCYPCSISCVVCVCLSTMMQYVLSSHLHICILVQMLVLVHI